MRMWQVERRWRTRHLIELGGLVVKAGIVDLTGDDRVAIYGALIWMANKLQSEDGEHARALWAAKGKQAFDDERKERKDETCTASEEAPHDEVRPMAGGAETSMSQRGTPSLYLRRTPGRPAST